MTPHDDSSSPRARTGQWLAVALIAAATLAIGALVLRGGAPHGADDGHGHGEQHAGHVSGAGHAGRDADASDAAGASAAPGGAAGTIPFTDRQVAASGIAIEAAAPGAIASAVQLPGEIRFNEDRTAHVVPRVAGVVESVSADLGQQVRRGQVLAVLSSAAVSDQRSELAAAQKRLGLARITAERERKLFEDRISAQQDYLQAEQAQREAEIAVANAAQKLRAIGAAPGGAELARYELRAPFDGMVVEKHLAIGEAVREDTNAFTISDLSSVWAQVNVSATNLPLVRVGGQATVRASGFEQSAPGRIAYVGALIGEQSRTALARVVLPNPQLAWRPGLFVTVELVAERTEAPVTVAAEAVQALDGRPTVFEKVDGGFAPRAVRTGRSDGRRVEIVEGLAAGAPIAGRGSFAVKAQHGKGAADHEH